MRNAHEWISKIIGCLFEPDNRRLQAWIDQICDKNTEFVGKDVHGYLYAGDFYRPSNVVGRITNKTPLHSSLSTDMEEFLYSKKLVDIEKGKVSQTLFMLLEPCVVEQDIRNTLPECIVDCLSDLKRWPRTKEPAFTIADNPRAIRQYEKLLPKMEEYSVARMLF